MSDRRVHLHYTFDLWAERWRRREATGDMIIVRYADDIIVGFEHEADARRFWEVMRERMQEFSLSLNSEKTLPNDHMSNLPIGSCRPPKDWRC